MRRLDEPLGLNLLLAAQVSSTVVVFGERHEDYFVTAGEAGADISVDLAQFLLKTFNCEGIWRYDPTRGKMVLAHGAVPAGVNTVLPSRTGDEKTLRLERALDALSTLDETHGARGGPTAWRYILLVDAEFLFDDFLSTQELRLIHAIARFSKHTPSACGLVLSCRGASDLPSVLSALRTVKSIGIPPATQDVRMAYAGQQVGQLTHASEAQRRQIVRTITWATDEWLLREIGQLVMLLQQHALTEPRRIEALARSLVSGVATSPWNGEELARVIARARPALEQRITGQPVAIDAVISGLEQSVIGISSERQGYNAHRPRAVFFFAGPTGVGKTEMAKAISQLVFGQERLLRFDCGELQEQHSIARLIGAPPGYVGHDQGGELTEGIRRNPNSIVLFDEIEKAHPRIFDLLLGVLDDGRLTSGQGETIYFDESIVIFTTNLGTRSLVDADTPAGAEQEGGLYDAGFETLQSVLRKAIRGEFMGRLNRPELFGRLGGENNIIVFDYLRDIRGTLTKFIGNIREGVHQHLNIALTVENDVLEHLVHQVNNDRNVLRLGGRGVRQVLDRGVTMALAAYIFRNKARDCRLAVTLGVGRNIEVSTSCAETPEVLVS